MAQLRLASRPKAPGVPDDDSISVAVERAKDALQQLNTDVHYKSIEGTDKAPNDR